MIRLFSLLFLLCLLAVEVEAAAPVASVSPSRTSGTAPLCIKFDATGTTDADTTKPFHDLLYTWNFGDSSAGRWSTGANTAIAKNQATGAVAAHCYETAGTYTWTMAVSDGTASDIETGTITVTAADTTFATTATVCFYNSTVGTGCPTGATQTQSSDFDAALSSCIGDTKRCLFKRGDTFTRSTTVNIGTSVLLQIGAYGSGALPIINGTNIDAITFNNASGADVRITDLEIIGNGSTDTGICINSSASPTNVTLIGVTCRDVGKGISVSSGQKITNFFMVGSTFYNYYASGGNAFFGFAEGGAFLGNTIGPVPSSGNGEHGLRIQSAIKVVVANNTFNPPNTSKSHLTIRAIAHTGGASVNAATDTRYVVVADNKFVATASPNQWMMQFAPAGSTQCNWGADIVAERNHFIYGSTASSVAVVSEWVRVTIRNNLFDLSGQGTSNGTGILLLNQQNGASLCTDSVGSTPSDTIPTPDDHQVINNTFYHSGAASAFYPVNIDGTGHTAVTNTIVKNNLAYGPNITTTATLPLTSGTTTGTSSSNNSTGSAGTNQIITVSPQFTGALTAPSGFAPATGSYAADGGVASFPATAFDFFGCYDKTGDNRIGAVVPRAQAQCRGVAGP